MRKLNKFKSYSNFTRLCIVFLSLTITFLFASCANSKLEADSPKPVTQEPQVTQSTQSTSVEPTPSIAENSNSGVVTPTPTPETRAEEKATASTITPTPSPFPTQQDSSVKATTPTPTPAQSSNKSSNGIKVKYGNHDYGCKTQEEYDKVIKKVEEAVANIDSVELSPYIKLYMEGKRAKDYTEDTAEYKGLTVVYKNVGFFLHKVDSQHHEKVLKLMMIYRDLVGNAKDPGTGKPRSAYDVIFNEVGDCDAYANLQAAVFDHGAYNTQIRQTESHAWNIVEIDGIWWDIVSGNISPTNPKSGYTHTEPTW